MIQLLWGVFFMAIAGCILLAYEPDMPVGLLLGGYVAGVVAVVFVSDWFIKEVW